MDAEMIFERKTRELFAGTRKIEPVLRSAVADSAHTADSVQQIWIDEVFDTDHVIVDVHVNDTPDDNIGAPGTVTDIQNVHLATFKLNRRFQHAWSTDFQTGQCRHSAGIEFRLVRRQRRR